MFLSVKYSIIELTSSKSRPSDSSITICSRSSRTDIAFNIRSSDFFCTPSAPNNVPSKKIAYLTNLTTSVLKNSEFSITLDSLTFFKDSAISFLISEFGTSFVFVTISTNVGTFLYSE